MDAGTLEVTAQSFLLSLLRSGALFVFAEASWPLALLNDLGCFFVCPLLGFEEASLLVRPDGLELLVDDRTSTPVFGGGCLGAVLRLPPGGPLYLFADDRLSVPVTCFEVEDGLDKSDCFPLLFLTSFSCVPFIILFGLFDFLSALFFDLLFC